jgi:DNA-binding Lrp family transcriptional regulator
MDEIDVKILKLLWEDGRMPIYMISKKVGLSNAAVYKRMKRMMDRGELLGFSILLNSDKILNSAVISIRARRKREEVMEILREISGVMHIVAGFGGRYYVEFWYGDEFELRDKVNYIKRLTGAYRIEIYKHKKVEDIRLQPIDWKILLGLKEGARQPFNELSKKIGISSKTISRRWKKLREMDVCKAYPIVNRPSTKEIFWFSLFIETDDPSLEIKIRKMANLWRTSIFAEPPMVYGVFYGRTIQEIDEVMENIVAMKGVKRVFYEIIVEESFIVDYLDYVAYKMGYKNGAITLFPS